MNRLLFTFTFLLFTFLCAAQSTPLTRPQLQDYTNSTIYANPNHAITGQTLQNTFSNYNNSCANLRTDTMFVLLFSNNYTYYLGMKVLIPDTILPAPVLTPYAYVGPALSPASYSTFPYQGIMRCDTISYRGPFDTIHFKPVLYGNWSNY